jgi:hypothetical protein
MKVPRYDQVSGISNLCFFISSMPGDIAINTPLTNIFRGEDMRYYAAQRVNSPTTNQLYIVRSFER